MLGSGTSQPGATTFPTTSSSLWTTSFGNQAPTGGLFGQQTQAPTGAQQPAPVAAQASSTSQVESVLSSVLYCNVYGDERDAILARWNLLQAAWGTGKGWFLS